MAFLTPCPTPSTRWITSPVPVCNTRTPRRPTMVSSVDSAATSPAAPSPQSSPKSAATVPTFGRIITAMVTPFKRANSEVDYSTAEKLASYLVANGSDALVIAGTTGESPTLSWSEQYELFTAVRNAVGHRVKLIAGAGSNSTSEAIEATRRAHKLGFDATLQVVPYYNKPPQEGLYQHFRAIAEAQSDLPIILYNIPGRTGINMSPETVTKLALIDNIAGIKHASNNTDELVEIRKSTSSNFSIYAGDDALTLPFLSLGATGVISVASHFVGPQLQKLVTHFLNGEVDQASEIHMRYNSLFQALFSMTNPIPTKTALRLQGWPVGGCRLPLIDATPDVEEQLASVLSELNLI